VCRSAAAPQKRKSKVKSQKAKIFDPNRWPGWARIFAARNQNNRQ
jgi:hypothetical protein